MTQSNMLVGYMRVSKSDGSQTVDPQRYALLAAGIEPDRLYEVVPGTRDTRQTLYRHVSPRAELCPDGLRLLAEGTTSPRSSPPQP